MKACMSFSLRIIHRTEAPGCASKFEQALKLHLDLCKPKTKKKSSQRLTSWQVEISKAVEEMDGYTQEDLAEEPEPGSEPEGDTVLDSA